MTDVTQILAQIRSGDPHAAEQFLPLVYDELRRLARVHMARERAEHTLEPTALVHEAYLRLVGDTNPHWEGRGHFFAAAAEAMRRILIEHARARKALRRGGNYERVPLDDFPHAVLRCDNVDELLALDDALERLAEQDPQSTQLVKLRYFTGLTIPQAAELLGISPRKANFLWSFARAWLRREMDDC